MRHGGHSERITLILRYYCYRKTIRQEQIQPLIDKILEGASDEEISALKGYLEWMAAQVKNREKVKDAA